eukprot:c20839_g1_i1 orf=197-460(+)
MLVTGSNGGAFIFFFFFGVCYGRCRLCGYTTDQEQKHSGSCVLREWTFVQCRVCWRLHLKGDAMFICFPYTNLSVVYRLCILRYLFP